MFGRSIGFFFFTHQSIAASVIRESWGRSKARMAAMALAFGSLLSVTHVNRLVMARPGSSMAVTSSSMALARTTSSSAVSRATLPISLRYIRTGSSR